MTEHAKVTPLGTWGAFLDFVREYLPLVDADFARDVAAARTALAPTMIPPDPWPC